MNGRREDDADQQREKVSWNIVAWILGVIVTALVTYNATTNSVNARVSVLEQKSTETDRRLVSIETKIDVLLARPR